jgi:hypothetical protein
MRTYVASDKFIFGEEAKVRWLLVREVPADREELLEVVPNNFQAGQSAGRARLERLVVATERWIKVVHRNSERGRSVTGAAQLDIRYCCLGHEFFLLVPE